MESQEDYERISLLGYKNHNLEICDARDPDAWDDMLSDPETLDCMVERAVMGCHVFGES